MKGPLDCGQNEIFPFLFFPAVKLNLGCWTKQFLLNSLRLET
jgi:hypothetical protein